MIPLWSAWPEVSQRLLAASHVLLFLDYDGTLAPLADRPEEARCPAATRRRLEELAARPDLWTAIVSGRSAADVQRALKLDGLCYVGNHGLEVMGPGLRYLNPVARLARPTMTRLRRELGRALEGIAGAWVEDKRLTLSVHYRQLSPRQWPAFRQQFFMVVRPYQAKRQIRVTEGKMVFEIRPPVHWTKGTVVQWLMGRRKAMAEEKPAIAVYVGDDVTDEDAFRAVGTQGITIAVGPSSPLTQAQYLVESPAGVTRFLRRLATLRTRAERERSRGC